MTPEDFRELLLETCFICFKNRGGNFATPASLTEFQGFSLFIKGQIQEEALFVTESTRTTIKLTLPICNEKLLFGIMEGIERVLEMHPKLRVKMNKFGVVSIYL